MARVTSKNSAPNGSALGFEATLWSAVEKLKGNAGEYKQIVLGHVSNVELVEHTDAASTGKKMPRANWNDIARFEVALPPDSLAVEFANLMNKALCDAMLPLPPSGELRAPSVLKKMSTVN